MNDKAGQAAGYPSAFGMGNLQWAYLHNLLRDWLADQGRILTLSCQFRGPSLRGQTVTAGGEVTAVEDSPESRKVSLRVWTQNQDGEPLAPGTAQILLPETPSR